MASHKIPQLSLLELVIVKIKQASLVVRLVTRLVGTTIFRSYGNQPFKRYISINFLKSNRWTARERSYIFPTTGDQIKTYCSKHQLELNSTLCVVGNGLPDATIHEITLEEASQGGSTMIYFHGGGYRNAISGAGHVPLALSLARASGCRRLLMLEYTLTPELKYPGQLVQAVTALNHIVGTKDLDPRELLMGGDSAGANLALAVLSHLQQKHPEVPQLKGIDQGRMLKGVFLLSPWVGMPCTAKSFQRNAATDYLSAERVHEFVAEWQPKSEVWADPLLAEKRLWKGVPVRQIILTAGTWEALEDDIVELAEKLKDCGAEVQLVMGENEVHVQPAADAALQMEPIGSWRALLDWMKGLSKV